MDLIFKVLLWAHIPAGFIGLVLFWIPAIVKKGGHIHIKVGKAYVFSMWIVVITALLMSIINAINKEYMVAAFLGFLAVLTSQSLWYAIAILKYKKDVPTSLLKLNKIMNLIIFFSGLGLLIWGILLKMQGFAILLVIFGILGLTSAGVAFRSLTKANENSNWLREHIGGMIGSGIASHTAFFAFGGGVFFGSIFSGPMLLIPWASPGIIGTIMIIYTTRKYGLIKSK